MPVQIHGCRNMQTRINKRSGKDRRVSTGTPTFPLRDSQGIIVSSDRRVSCDRRTDGLELIELNISQKNFQAAFKKFRNLDS